VVPDDHCHVFPNLDTSASMFRCICSLSNSVRRSPPNSGIVQRTEMPSADEVKNLEGVSAAQHRFRLSVNVNPGDTPMETGPSSATTVANPPRPPPEQAGNGPFLVRRRRSGCFL
jgi:hypothetical protein